MRGILLLIATILVTITLLSPPTVQTQQPEKDQFPKPHNPEKDKFPKPETYPQAGANCKNKWELEPLLTMPNVRPGKSRCVLSFYNCKTRKTDIYQSGERDSGTVPLNCNDYLRAKEALGRIEICCDPKCERPTPWFDGLTPNSKCKDRQELQTSDDGKSVVYLRMCGWNVFAYDLSRLLSPGADDHALILAAYKSGLLDHVRPTVGSTVCCDSFSAQARPGSSCDPRLDLDCDGTSNATDRTEDERFPDISTFAIAAGVPIKDTDPLPPWFQPGDKGFMPPANLCDCKWEIKKSTRTCSPDGRRPHVYQIRWRCPSSGNERFTRKEAPATEPCGPEPETMGSFILVPDLSIYKWL